MSENERDRDRDNRDGDEREREDEAGELGEKFTWTSDDVSGLVWLDDETEKEEDDGGE